jgi:hypothetical protein
MCWIQPEIQAQSYQIGSRRPTAQQTSFLYIYVGLTWAERQPISFLIEIDERQN